MGVKTEVPTSHEYSASHCFKSMVTSTELIERIKLQSQKLLIITARDPTLLSSSEFLVDSTRNAVTIAEKRAAYSKQVQINEGVHIDTPLAPTKTNRVSNS